MNHTLGKRRQNFIEKLDRTKNGEYELVGDYLHQRSRTRFKRKLCGYEWDTTPVTLINSKGLFGRPNCQYRAKSYTTEEYKERLKNIHNGEFTLCDGQEYITNTKKLIYRHETCGFIFNASPATIASNGSCPKCRQTVWRGKTTKEFEKDLLESKGEEYILADDSEYRGANEKVRILHTACGYEWDVRAAHILHRSGCPVCKESKGEKFISTYLEKLGVKFDREYTFADCKNVKELPFDFAIYDTFGNIHTLVEYDGVQHFKPFKHFGGEDKLERQQRNDKIKNEYCLNNNIPLLRIPYTMSKENIRKVIRKTIAKK